MDGRLVRAALAGGLVMFVLVIALDVLRAEPRAIPSQTTVDAPDPSGDEATTSVLSTTTPVTTTTVTTTTTPVTTTTTPLTTTTASREDDQEEPTTSRASPRRSDDTPPASTLDTESGATPSDSEPED